MTDAGKVLVASSHRRMRWRNGGGWTTELIAWPERTDWQWRLSLADIEEPGPFSRFPNVDRTIALVRGNGFTLQSVGKPTSLIDQPYRTFEFPGDDHMSCELLDGPVQAINLMVRPGAGQLQLGFIHTSSSVELTDWELAVLVCGQLAIGDRRISPLDAIQPARMGRPIVLNAVDAVIALVSRR